MCGFDDAVEVLALAGWIDTTTISTAVEVSKNRTKMIAFSLFLKWIDEWTL